MPTNKPKIAGYLNQDLFDRFKAFASENNLSDSQAIAHILEEYFGGESPTSQGELPSSASRLDALEDEVRLLKDMYSPIYDKLFKSESQGESQDGILDDIVNLGGKLPSELPTIINELPSELPSELPTIINELPSELPSELPAIINELPSELPSELPAIINELPSELPSELPTIINELPSELPSELPTIINELPSELPSELPTIINELPGELPRELPPNKDIAWLGRKGIKRKDAIALLREQPDRNEALKVWQQK